MSAEEETETAPDFGAVHAPRDFLGRVCFWLHFGVMLYVLLGWSAPTRAALVFYELFLPAVAIQWWFNKNSCVLNNLESKIRTGSWRSPANPEEGAWLLTLIRSWLGLPVTPLQMEFVTYGILIALWGVGLWRVAGTL